MNNERVVDQSKRINNTAIMDGGRAISALESTNSRVNNGLG
jgi:hypothetical protein